MTKQTTIVVIDSLRVNSHIQQKGKILAICKMHKPVWLFIDLICHMCCVKLESLSAKYAEHPLTKNVVCLCRLLNILADFSNLFLHTGKQCGP